MERRLTAILAADVVGYSRLMEIDEVGTLATLQTYRKELIDPIIASRSGRLVKLIGDGALVEFASVVDAVSSAVEMQKGIDERNVDVAEGDRIEFRIGVHLGDVIVEGDDIYGDGVNVAARLESLADTGGICISQQAFDQIETKLDLSYKDMGEQKVKNIVRSVRAYKVMLDGAVAQSPRRAKSNKSRRVGLMRIVSVAASLIIVGLIAAWWQPWQLGFEPASVEHMAFPLPDRPSLAVLPFTNMSDDPVQEHFADGMTEDLITDLSQISGLFVIARNSTFVYKGQAVQVRQVAEDLGVRYVLEGSVRRVGDQVRVNAQLIDAVTGGHVWADRYDGGVADIFAVQDTFIRKIVGALAVNLTEEEQEEIALGQTANVEAREVFQEGWASYLRYSAEDNAAAIDQFKKALGLDPEYGRAYAALSLAYLRGCRLKWNDSLGMSAHMANWNAKTYLRETEARPSSLANVAASGISLYNNRYDDAQTEAARAIAKDPNDPEAYIAMAWAMITTGRPEPGLEMVERAMRLNPTYPRYYALAQGMAYFTMDDLEKAAEVFAEALERDRGATELAAVLAATYAQLGRQDEAHAALRRWKPEASQSELQAAPDKYRFPYKYQWSEGPEIVERLIDGLHLAALPPGTLVSDLAKALKRGESRERLYAAQNLGRFGPRAVEAVPVLIDALADEVVGVRRAAAIALGNIGPAAEVAIPALTAITDDRVMGFDARKAISRIAGE